MGGIEAEKWYAASVCGCKSHFPSFSQWHRLSFSRAERYMWLSHVTCSALALTDERKEPLNTHTHTHAWTDKRLCMRAVLWMKVLYSADLAVWKGLEGIVLLRLTQQSISTRFLCVTARAVAVGGGLINVAVGRGVSFVTGHLGENQMQLRQVVKINKRSETLATLITK